MAQLAAHHRPLASVKPSDDAIDKLPQNQPVLSITASYEGEPPDNANRFITWATSPDTTDLSNVRYAVFGCGSRDRKETCQRIPTLTNKKLEEKQAERLTIRGLTDAVNNHVFNDFEKWEDQQCKTDLVVLRSPVKQGS